MVVGIGGENIIGVPSNGVVGINSKDQEIKREDIYRSLEVARAFELPRTGRYSIRWFRNFVSTDKPASRILSTCSDTGWKAAS